MKHFNIRVTGKVQGVFFRASTKEQADVFKIKGFVRNEMNGNVYIEAEGDETAMNQFLEWCSHGPSRARVDHIEKKEGKLKNFESFEVAR